MKNLEEMFKLTEAKAIFIVISAMMILLGLTIRHDFNKPRTDRNFVKVTVMECNPIEDSWDSSQTALLQDFEKKLTTCGVTYSDHYIRKSLIKYKQVLFETRLKWSSSGNTIVEISPNHPYCELGLDYGRLYVSEPCEDIQ